MDFTLLADRPQAIPRIAGWYFDQWGDPPGGFGIEGTIERLRGFLNRDRVPLMVLAVDGDELLGVAQIKFREMEIYPDREHWLGGVYVPARHRGRGVGAGVIGEALRVAPTLGVERLHLQTEALDGGLYARLGWKPVERVTYRGIAVLVMEQDLRPSPGPMQPVPSR